MYIVRLKSNLTQLESEFIFQDIDHFNPNACATNSKTVKNRAELKNQRK